MGTLYPLGWVRSSEAEARLCTVLTGMGWAECILMGRGWVGCILMGRGIVGMHYKRPGGTPASLGWDRWPMADGCCSPQMGSDHKSYIFGKAHQNIKYLKSCLL